MAFGQNRVREGFKGAFFTQRFERSNIAIVDQILAGTMRSAQLQRLRFRLRWVNSSVLPYSNTPTTQAVMKAASVPPIMARSPNRAKSDFLSGAIPPIPQIWIPILPKLANPHRA